jgi:hypothetical protein
MIGSVLFITDFPKSFIVFDDFLYFLKTSSILLSMGLKICISSTLNNLALYDKIPLHSIRNQGQWYSVCFDFYNGSNIVPHSLLRLKLSNFYLHPVILIRIIATSLPDRHLFLSQTAYLLVIGILLSLMFHLGALLFNSLINVIHFPFISIYFLFWKSKSRFMWSHCCLCLCTPLSQFFDTLSQFLWNLLCISWHLSPSQWLTS